MSIHHTNGFSAYAAGYARNANPVAYCLNGVFSAAQARLRDEWFAGWDAAEAEKLHQRIQRLRWDAAEAAK